MACWSAENATKAYLKTMRMGKNAKEPNGAEFISAMAAGNNAQLMVVACSGAADSTALALLAAAQQTGGRLVCILQGQDELLSSAAALGPNAGNIDFIIGDAKVLIPGCYKDSDFIAIDCNLENHEEIIGAAVQEDARAHGNTIVLGYNAFCRETWRNSPLRTQLLPIGEGLLLTRVVPPAAKRSKSNWIVKVDKCTGEEHVFRVRSSVGRFIRA
ncbi:hypothetical protein SASPL_123046 [Salvia splendens]|uniref:Uncharacterized protein n=1 Tax=Salvia splendens TaxID=180675 RepID=A0A4D9BXY2_SALSN|nr:uncharacterized protein LOC121745721 [Salvia splendens]XP_041995627.1 uncharacterized protein LOC121745723 [Salvia splendens]KAG6415630.1 hypothetical protein SASPL_123043 [Salvia splendens]KAG6415633.1 hypothetical protein SASPL_123046 [Salvia splendens]